MKQLHWKKCLMAVAIAFAGVLGAASFGPTGMTAKAEGSGLTAEDPFEINTSEKLVDFLLGQENSDISTRGKNAHGRYGILESDISISGLAVEGTRALDLNGHTISAAVEDGSIISLDAGDDLTIKDTGSGGKIRNTYSANPMSNGDGVFSKAILVSGGTLTLEGIEIGGSSYSGINVTGGYVDIQGGKIDTPYCPITLEGGTMALSSGVLVKGEITIVNGTLSVYNAKIQGSISRIAGTVSLYGGYYQDESASIESFLGSGNYVINSGNYEIDDYTYHSHITTTDVPAFYDGHSLVITNDVGIDFLMTLPGGLENFPNSYMSFTGNKISEDHVTAQYYSGDIYKYTVHVSSIQMGEKITPTFHYFVDEVEQTIEGTAYSVDDYLVAAKNSPLLTSAQNEIVKTLADYGYHAQRYLSVQNHWTIGEDYAAMTAYGDRTTKDALNYSDVTQPTATGSSYLIKSLSSTKVSKVTYALNFGSKISIYLYLTPVDGETIDSITVDGQSVTPVKSGSRYVVIVPDIYVTALTSEHTIVADDMTITVSPYCYIRAMLSSETVSEEGKNLVAALYWYSEACK